MNYSALKRYKSKIAIHARNISAILLVLILVLITAIIFVIINGINNNAAKNLVHAISTDSADRFSHYINRDLALTRKTAVSRAMTSWFADEENESKKAAAFDEMLDYADLFQGIELYFGIHETLNEYSIDSSTTLEDFIPFDKLDQNRPGDIWYFECIYSENDYTLKVDPEIRSGIWYLWINHKVASNGNIMGIFASGLEIPDIFSETFEGYGNDALRGYVVNKNGAIWLHGDSEGTIPQKNYKYIFEEYTDPAFTAAFASYTDRITGIFDDSRSHSEVIRLAKGGQYGYAAIKPITDTDWSVVVFYRHSSLSALMEYLPLLIVLLSALFLYVAARDILMRRFIYSPLNRLTHSVLQADSNDVDFFGKDRDDEIGDLARSIRRMWDNLNAQSKQIREEHSRAQVLMDSMPLTGNLWNRDAVIFDCNEEAVKLFKVKDKQFYIKNFFLCSPEHQPDGELSAEKGTMYVRKAFEEGRCVFDWMHQTIDGTPIPAEVTLVRVKFGDDFAVAGYARDLREYRDMMSEIGRQEFKLKEALNTAQAANKAKSGFLATMSHEMRTPMNAILGIAEIQLQNESLSSKTREALEKIYNSGDLLLNIINDILDLSKIEAGKLELAPAEYKAASLINDTVTLNMMRIGSKPIEFELSVDKSTPSTLFGDELRIKQILNNILSNAIKYTKEGSVAFSVSTEAPPLDEDGVTLVFTVSDTGQGMTEEQVGKLFDEYSRFNTAANRSTEGTGLGMSITQNLVRMMKGGISVTSEQKKGTAFTIRLPQQVIGDDVIGGELAESLERFQLNGMKQLKRSQVVFEPMPYGKVLIVDDVESNLYVAKGLMSPYELTIETVISGFEAIDKIKNGGVYDIIFMDHMMPLMDGLETTTKIRDMGYRQPIVALTANAVVGQSDVFLANGFDGFISKPIDIRQLNAALKKFVRDRQPPNVIEAAQQAQKQTEDKAAQSTSDHAIDPRLAEIFVRDARKTLAVLEEIHEKNNAAYGDEDVRAYTINTHGIKSALANIGETELSAAALRLEKAGRANDTAVMTSQTAPFLDDLRSIIEKYAPPQEDGYSADEDTKEALAFLREKLPVIIEACEVYNKKTAKDAINELREKSWSKTTRDMLGNMADHLLNGDFKDVIQAAQKIIETP